MYIYIYIQCNPDISELLGPEKISLISEFILYQGLLYPDYTIYEYIYILI